jgi:hypothetical protein
MKPEYNRAAKRKHRAVVSLLHIAFGVSRHALKVHRQRDWAP